MKFDIYTTNTLAVTCMSTAVSDDHQPLLQKLSQDYPDLHFTHVLTRGGWHRTGGVLSKEGKRITDSLPVWLETESDGDINLFIDRYLEAEYIVTRIIGSTHYFVASTGDAASDFVQLEVEELQEIKDHILLASEVLPDDFEDVANPAMIEKLPAEPVAEACYRFRRITSISDFTRSMSEGICSETCRPDDKAVTMRRFMDDWDRSSSKESGPFCQHWVLSLQQHTDVYGEPIMHARPVSTYGDTLPKITLTVEDRGLRLANLIHGFDHNVGFPMAWYFYMLSDRAVPHLLAEVIHKELMGAYAYLPAKDLKVVNDWYGQPYGI